jgi:hypothetical protein
MRFSIGFYFMQLCTLIEKERHALLAGARVVEIQTSVTDARGIAARWATEKPQLFHSSAVYKTSQRCVFG